MREPLLPGSIIRWRDREATIVVDEGDEKMVVYSPRVGGNVNWSWIMKGDACEIVRAITPGNIDPNEEVHSQEYVPFERTQSRPRSIRQTPVQAHVAHLLGEANRNQDVYVLGPGDPNIPAGPTGTSNTDMRGLTGVTGYFSHMPGPLRGITPHRNLAIESNPSFSREELMERRFNIDSHPHENIQLVSDGTNWHITESNHTP